MARATAKKARTNPEYKIVGTIGDVNPIEYGGGIVYVTERGPVIEYTAGLEGEGVDIGDEDEGSVELPVYQVDVEDDVFADLNWVGDWKQIANTIGTSVSELRQAATSKNTMERVWVYEAVATTWGWQNLDASPSTMTVDGLNERWFDEPYKANATTLTYGQLPTKQQFMNIYAHEMGDGSYSMTLRGKADTSAAKNTVFKDAIETKAEFDADEVWEGLKQLKRKFDRGNDEAGDLASGVLQTLHIEWV